MRHSLLLILVICLVAPCARALYVTFANPDGSRVQFDLEVADTRAKRRKGMMFRKELPPHKGMLFVYSEPRTMSMWMKNTPLTLDVIFVGADNKVQHIEHEAQPFSKDAIGPVENTVRVVEVLGGTAAKHGILKGSQFTEHPE